MSQSIIPPPLQSYTPSPTEYREDIIPIFLSADEMYAPYISVIISSIMEQTNHCVEFHILDCGIAKRTQAVLTQYISSYPNATVLFHVIPQEDIENFPAPAHYSIAMYARFYIAELVPTITKALYLDIDMCVIGDIADIFTHDLGEYALGAVSADADNIYITPSKEFYTHKEMIGLTPNEYYFCSGLLLIDCDYWRKHNIKQQSLELMNTISYELIYPDQDVLNILFRSNYKILPPYLEYYANESSHIYHDSIQAYIERGQAITIHYTSKRKPWNSPIDAIPFASFWWKYARLTPFYTMFSLDILHTKMDKSIELTRTVYRKTCYTHLISYLKYKFARGEKRKQYKKEYLMLKNL